MPGTPTTRLSLPTVDGTTDAVSTYPSVNETQMDTLDEAALYTSGPLADLPAAGDVPAGSMYYATDAGFVLHAVGTGASATLWIQSMFSPGDLKCSALAAPPSGWLVANGGSFNPTAYPFLYAAIGTTFGGSSSAPKLPDLRGRLPIGVGSGTATGASAWALGATPTSGRGGEETHQLLTAELASHSHAVSTGYASIETSVADMSSSVSVTVESNSWGPGGLEYVGLSGGSWSINEGGFTSGGQFAPYYSGGSADNVTDSGHGHGAVTSWDIYDQGHAHGDAGHSHTAGNAGSGTAHNTVPPVTALNWFIKT